MKRFVRATALALVVSLASVAGAQSAPTPEQIKQAGAAFDQGKRHFKAGEFIEAAEQFEAADAAAPSPAALQLAIRSREKGGQLDRAATLARLGLDRHPGNAELKELADGVFEKVAEDHHALTVRCDTPCTLVVNTRLVHGAAANVRTLYLKAGDYQIRASWPEDRVVSKPATATGGGASELAFAEPPKPPPEEEDDDPPPPPPGGGTGEDTGTVKVEPSGGIPPGVFWVGLSLTAVAGGVTAWSGYDTLENPGKSKVQSECAGQGKQCQLYKDGVAKQDRTNILLGVTGVLGVGTIIIALLTDWSGEEGTASYTSRKRTAKQSIQPWIGVGNGATLGATGRF